MKNRLILVFVLSVSSCYVREQDETLFSDIHSEYREISAFVKSDETKTVFEEGKLSFVGGDRLCVYAFTNEANPVYLNTFSLFNTHYNVNKFTGIFKSRDQRIIDANFYALYPDSFPQEGGIVTAEVPVAQQAPFDPAAAILFASDRKTYNEEDMPSLILSFQQLLAPIRIDFVNDYSDYESDELLFFEIESEDNISGSFQFDVAEPEKLDFSTGENKLRSVFPKGTLLGPGVSSMVMLRPGELSRLRIKVVTGPRVFSFSLSSELTIDKDYINVVSLKASDATQDVRKVVACWGDSYTNRESRPVTYNTCNYSVHLQELLGEDWYVYNGGYNGDVSTNIINKLKDWEDINDATLSILYMGRNDNAGPTDYAQLKSRYETAISYLTNDEDYIVLGSHNRQFWSVAEEYPVVVSSEEKLDFHENDNGNTYEGAFIAYFANTGKYIDLFHTVTNDWKNWLVRTGRYPTVEAIDESTEYPGTNKGADGAVMIDTNGDGIKDTAIDWPQSFWFQNSVHERRYVHPSEYGAKAIAIMIYNKMVDLGYVTP